MKKLALIIVDGEIYEVQLLDDAEFERKTRYIADYTSGAATLVWATLLNVGAIIH